MSRQKRKMKWVCHPEPRNGGRAWGFKEEEDNSQDNKKKIKCIII